MTHEEKVRRALAFVAEFKGDERCALNSMYSEALASEVATLSVKFDTAEQQILHLQEARALDLAMIQELDAAQGALSVKLEETETLLSDQKAYTQDFMRQIRGLQAKLEGATARSRLVEERVLQCIDASWHGTDAMVDPSLVLQEYIDHLRVKLEEAQAEIARQGECERAMIGAAHSWARRAEILQDALADQNRLPPDFVVPQGVIDAVNRPFVHADVAPDAPRTYAALKGKAVLVVRAYDTLGRRHTDFAELNVSPGIDGVQLAQRIAVALTAEASPGEIVKACPRCGCWDLSATFCKGCKAPYDEPTYYQKVSGGPA